MGTYIEARGDTTYVLEFACKGSRKIVASAMPTNHPAPDVRIPLRKVPLQIRRNARAALSEED